MRFKFLLPLLLLFACAKDEANPAKSEHPLSGSNEKVWLFVEETLFVNGVESNSHVKVEPCTADDFITFRSNATYTFDNGQKKCSTGEDQTTTGTWNINGKTFTTESQQGKIESQIVELTNSRFSVKRIEEHNLPEPYGKVVWETVETYKAK